MPYIVKLKRSAEKELDRLPEKVYDRVVASLLDLKKNPLPVGVKKTSWSRRLQNKSR